MNAGKFTFRFWLNDVTPPSVKLLGYSGGVLRLAISDRGSGVDPGSIIAGIDGNANVDGSYAKGVLSIRTGSLSGGKHTIEVDVSDYQEAKNMEDVLRILPNTRVFKTSFTVR